MNLFIPKTNAAFVMSPRLGDTLIAMIIVNNLHRNGYDITVYSNHLDALRSWFPTFKIKPYPKESSELKTFTTLIHTYPSDTLFQSEQWHPNVIVLDKLAIYRRCISMVDLQVAVCKELFGLTDAVRTNGLTPPQKLNARINHQRVIIHPTASHPSKCWLPNRFIELAQRLTQKGYFPVFVAAESERPTLTWIEANNFSLFIPSSLDDLAGYLYESYCCIGNDSGIAHFASNLGLPTITLNQRRKNKIRWRPNWAENEALLPKMPLLVKAWKEKYWKYFISASDVMKKFDHLIEK